MSQARKDLCLFTPQQMYQLRTLVTAHKVYAIGEPSDLSSLFQTYADSRVCERVTRSDLRMRPPAMRTAAGQRSFAFRAACMLNDISMEVRALPPGSFKREVKSLVARNI